MIVVSVSYCGSDFGQCQLQCKYCGQVQCPVAAVIVDKCQFPVAVIVVVANRFNIQFILALPNYFVELNSNHDTLQFELDWLLKGGTLKEESLPQMDLENRSGRNYRKRRAHQEEEEEEGEGLLKDSNEQQKHSQTSSIDTSPQSNSNSHSANGQEASNIVTKVSLQSIDDDSLVRTIIQNTKVRQKMRNRHKGIDVSVIETLTDHSLSSTSDPNTNSLDTNFTAQTHHTETDHHMERYIEERMSNKNAEERASDMEGYGLQQPGANSSSQNEKDDEHDEDVQHQDQSTDDETLYATPDHLKVEKTQDPETGSQMLTGIVEVELPIEYKLKNIEDTETAKRKLLGQNKKTFHPSMPLPANMSVNFSRHHQTQGGRKVVSANSHTHTGGSSGSSGSSVLNLHGGSRVGGNRKVMATDDLVLERFKKRFRY